ncbi:MAG: hypothetical protein KF867_03655 [Cryobacterium sp.]|nr:hypothetical protein [Cryobacterium sp.]
MNANVWAELTEFTIWALQFTMVFCFAYAGLGLLFAPRERLQDDRRKPAVARLQGLLEVAGAVVLVLPIFAGMGQRAVPFIAVGLAVLAAVDLASRWRHQGLWFTVGTLALIAISVLVAVTRTVLMP